MASLDISLDDMIKSRKNTQKGGRGQGQGQGQGQGRGRAQRGRGAGWSSRGRRLFGAPRRNPLGVNARSAAFSIAKSFRRAKNAPWQNDMFEESLKAAGLSGLEAGTKLHISNLDSGVSNEDIRELFSEIGELIRYAIHFNKNGRPSGSAEVVFARRSDAFQALKRYNNVHLDGKPMKIEIFGANAEIPLSARVNVVGGANGKRTVVMASGPGRSRGGFAAPNRGSGRIGRSGSNVQGCGGGRGRGRGGAQRRNKTGKSADQLDKELESYHAEAMQT